MKPRFTITALALVVGLLSLFYGHLVPEIRHFDSSCIHLYSAADEMLYEDDFANERVSFRPLLNSTQTDDRYQVIAITDDPNHIFETSPPSPLDYAVILDSLYERGHRSIIFATQIAWDNYTEMELQSLNGRLALFDRAVIPLSITRGANKQNLPPSLRRSLIPPSHITGKYQSLPVVNQVTLSNLVNGAEQTYAGFSKIESTPTSEEAIQLLAQWEGEGVIPSLELLTLISAHDITINDIIVHSGKSIQLGSDGLFIPIDEFGRTPLLLSKNTNRAPIETQDAEQLMESIENYDLKELSKTSIILATGEHVISTNSISPDRLNRLFETATTFQSPGKKFTLLKIPHWAEILIIIDLSIFIYIALSLSTGSRHFAFALLATGTFVSLMALIQILNHWMFISAPAAAILTAWILSTLFYKRNH